MYQWALILLAALVVALVMPRWVWRRFFLPIANAAPAAQKVLKSPWVIDGDTIDDRAAGIRYRVANIDAPETGENAKCKYERFLGEAATAAAIQIVRDAKVVSVRPTWRTDRYGRRVAYVLVDGADFGDILVKRGLARPWRGQREKWCGPHGGLSKIARSQARAFHCRFCSHWH
jgi:endonuclease YncB( thermonuclease family)